mmetsp:Transcript_14137/g.18522  ORF Transcript_14137/g.18522 Transcript_14137/m.18522 type:complete len:215 (+) Transcript_14137:20-664(+)
MSHDLTLTYFDISAGRGEPIRMALYYGSIAFEDERLGIEEYLAKKNELPMGQVPVLTIRSTGKVISQSAAILRYIGKIAGLYPEDPAAALKCDMIMDTVNETADLMRRIRHSPGQEQESKIDDQQIKALEDLVEDRLKPFFANIEGQLQAAGTNFFLGDQVTICDLCTYEFIRILIQGTLDVSYDARTDFPTLASLYQGIENESRLEPYFHSLV